MSTAAAPLTIREARPDVGRARIIIGTIFLVCFIFTAGFLVMSRVLLSQNPLLLARAPWLLPLWVLWGVYLSLALVIRSYANLFLPRTPVDVDEGIMDVGVVAIGCCVFGPMEVLVMTIPMEDKRVVGACTGVVAAMIAGLLVFWAWLIRRYGGPAASPADEIAR